ncbi:hypothetical protein [Streptomyces fructofermentans]|uniref:hypothetical protein n=1 Tax=Streptomyces fructofermentans TaxID=152141 RepID=UPI0037975041
MEHVLSGLAANPALPPELVDVLIAKADADLGDVLAERTDLSRAQALALVARGEERAVRLVRSGLLTAADVDPASRPDLALALLDSGNGRPDWARTLAADPDVGRRERLAGCPGLPPDVGDALAEDPDVRVVVELALWTTADVAARLARHPHAEVRRAVAVNEATPPAVLAALVTGEGLPPASACLVCEREPTPFVHDLSCPRPDCDLPADASCDGSHASTVHALRLAVLGHPATPVRAVVGFADHPCVLLRERLATRSDLPPEVYRRLAVDSTPRLRAELAGNPAVGEDLMRELASDEHPDVRRALVRNPRIPLDLLTRSAAFRGTDPLPRIESASLEEIETLARSADPAVRMLAARRRHLPDGIRDALAADPDAKVASSVAAHPGLSQAQLREMVRRWGVQVIARIAVNPDASSELLEELARHEPPALRALREIARHPRAPASALLACMADTRARRTAAGRPSLPPAVVAELLDDTDWQVVTAAAANPSLPPAAMAAAAHPR